MWNTFVVIILGLLIVLIAVNVISLIRKTIEIGLTVDLLIGFVVSAIAEAVLIYGFVSTLSNL
jgi:hypothetical protein